MFFALLFSHAHRWRGLSNYISFQADSLMGRDSREIGYPRAGKANLLLEIHIMVREPV